MAPGDLQEVLGVLKPTGPPPADLLVGLGAADDAAVYRLAPDLAIVETVDFFPPIVDDPWTWGAVAAVNAMSDVYAMGGEVIFALAVAGFPREMSKTIISEAFRGGRAKVGGCGSPGFRLSSRAAPDRETAFSCQSRSARASLRPRRRTASPSRTFSRAP